MSTLVTSSAFCFCSSHEAYPGVLLCGQPVPDDPSGLMHECTGSDCSFCAWRKDNPIELGWERLLETPESENSASNLCGVDLGCLDGQSLLRIIYPADSRFLTNLDGDCYFSNVYSDFEQSLSKYDSTYPSFCQPKSSATELPSVSTIPTASQAPCVSTPAAASTSA